MEYFILYLKKNKYTSFKIFVFSCFCMQHCLCMVGTVTMVDTVSMVGTVTMLGTVTMVPTVLRGTINYVYYNLVGICPILYFKNIT